MASFFVRKKLYRAVAVYLGSSWVLIEAANHFFNRFSIPHYYGDMLIILLGFGLISFVYTNWATQNKQTAIGSRSYLFNIINLVVAIGVIYTYWGRALSSDIQHVGSSQADERLSIAVLPFEDMSPKKDHEWLGNTISDRMIDQLGQIQSIDVKSRSASFYFQGKDFNTVQIARLLEVNTLLEGTVLVLDSIIQVSVKMINPMSGSLIWNATFQRPYVKLMEFQAEIALAVAENIGAHLSRVEKNQVNSHITESSEAYEAFMIGKYHYNLMTVTDLNRAHDYFKKAISLDPEFAEAYVYLGLTYDIFGGYWLGLSPNVAYKKVDELADKALQLKPDLALGHFLKSHVTYFYDGDYAKGLQMATNAYQMGTNEEDMIWLYSLMLSMQKKGDKAVSLLEEYISNNPTSTQAYEALCAARLIRDYRDKQVTLDEMLAPCKKCLELDSTTYYANYYIAEGYFVRNQYDKAKTVYKELVQLSPAPHFIEGLFRMNYYSGDTVAAMTLFEQLEATSQQIPIPYVMARAYSTLGDFDNMMINLEKAYEIRDIEIINLWLDASLDPARDDPRFKALLNRMNYAFDEN